MTYDELKDSLEFWEEREERFRRNWRSKRRGDPRRFYWFQMLKRAIEMVDRRTEQLEKLGVQTVSDKGLDLIKEFEGFRSCPYLDPVGVWTIGYGETRGITGRTKCWSKDYATKRLKLRVQRDYLRPVLEMTNTVNFRLRQHEADALASLVYNLGPGILAKGRTMGDALRTRNRDRIADAFLVYDKAGGQTLPGLTRRRRREREMFLGR